MSTNRPRGAGQQGKRPRRQRTSEDRERRSAAFASKKRGRPKGSKLAFFDDPDRFAIALVHCAVVFRGMSLHHSADIAVALTSDVPLETASIDQIREALGGPDVRRYVQFSGGPAHATLKGAAGGLVAKSKAPRTREEDEWIKLSAAGLDALLDLHFSPRPIFDWSYLRVMFDFLAALGWTSVLVPVIQKLSLAARSNFPPAEQPPSRRTIDLLWPTRKS